MDGKRFTTMKIYGAWSSLIHRLCACLAIFPIVAQSNSATVTYQYDASGHLTKATYGNGMTVTYSFDVADNRTQVVTQAPVNGGTLALNAISYSVTEDAGSITFTVSRTGGSQGTVLVDYSTEDGTATSGSDYQTSSGTLVWEDGDTTPRTFTVNVLADNVVEGDETFSVKLQDNSETTTLGTSVAPVVIHDATVPQYVFDFNGGYYEYYPYEIREGYSPDYGIGDISPWYTPDGYSVGGFWRNIDPLGGYWTSITLLVIGPNGATPNPSWLKSVQLTNAAYTSLDAADATAYCDYGYCEWTWYGTIDDPSFYGDGQLTIYHNP